MSIFVWLLLVLAAAVFQFVVVPIHLIFLLVVYFIDRHSQTVSFWLAFVAGILNDVFLAVRWGTTSLFFLVFVVIWKKSRSFFSQPLVSILLLTIFEGIYGRIIFHAWNWLQALACGLIGWYFVRSSRHVRFIKRDRLKLDEVEN